MLSLELYLSLLDELSNKNSKERMIIRIRHGSSLLNTKPKASLFLHKGRFIQKLCEPHFEIQEKYL